MPTPRDYSLASTSAVFVVILTAVEQMQSIRRLKAYEESKHAMWVICT